MYRYILRRFVSIILVMIVFTVSLYGLPTAAEDSGDRFKESTATILNPGMGYTTTLWYRCAPGDTPVQNPSGPLVLMFIDIGKFSSGENGTTDENGKYIPGQDYPLDDTFFAGLRGTFDNCRNNGSTIALRFRYDDDGTLDPEPASFEMLKSHVLQIADNGLLNDYQDILMFVECGFVGCFGEQWGGKYCSLSQKAELLDLMLNIVPDPIPVTVRTPDVFMKWAEISQAELADWQSPPGSNAARVGLYDDGYLGSDSDLGTYSNRTVETDWLGRQTLRTYFGGEFSGNLEFAQKFDTYLPENAIPEMYQTHLSYINSNIFGLYQDYIFESQYDIPNVDNSSYYGQSVYKFIRDHLGYRFVLRSVTLPVSVKQGEELTASFALENTGFANPIRKQKAELLLEKDGYYLRTEVPLDSREWVSCSVNEETVSAVLPGSLQPGEWNVYLKLSVGNNTVPQTHMRSVRFANPNTWNTALGANYLGTVTVQQETDSLKRSGTSFGVGDGTLYTFNGLQIMDGEVSSLSELGTPSAVSDTGRLYLHSDEQYLYFTATYDAEAKAAVHNFSFTNEANGERYWIYFQSNGFIYFNHGTPEGCLLLHNNGIVEFRVPYGEVMGLKHSITLSKIRYYLQDSADEWSVCSDVTADSFTLDGSFPVYTALREIMLGAGCDFTVSVTDGAAAPATYQWYHDGKAISGAESSLYTIQNASIDSKGLYSVKIISANGNAKTAEICRVTEVVESDLRGDINADGKVSVSDAIALSRWLLIMDHSLPAWKNGDLDDDGRLTVKDLTMLKRLLI